MKSNTFVAFASLMLVVSYLLVMRLETEEHGEMARFVPHTALMYYEQRNGYEILNQFSRSPLGKKIEEIDFVTILEDIDAGEPAVSFVKNMTEMIRSIKDNVSLDLLCGKKFAVLLLPPLDSQSSSNDLQSFLKANLVIAATPQHPETFLEKFISLPSVKRGEGAVQSTQYGSHRILRFAFIGHDFSLVILDGVFVMSTSERQLRKCIDTFDGEVPSFSESPEYLAVHSSFHQPESLFTFSCTNIEKYIASGIGFNFPLIDKYLPGRSHQIRGFTGFGYAAKRSKSTLRNKINIHYDPEMVSALLTELLDRQPVKDVRHTLTTATPMLYLWTNTFNFRNINAIIESNGKDAVQDSTAAVNETLAGKASQLASMFGEEIVAIVEPGKENSMLSIPRAVFFIPVTDREGVREILSEIAANFNIPIEHGRTGKAEYSFWSQSPQDGMYLLFGFLGDRLFAGNSPSLVEEVLETHSNGGSLLDGAVAKKIDPGFSAENNVTVFSNNAQIFDLLKTSLKILGTLATIEDRQSAQKMQIVTDKILVPLLDGAKMYNVSSLRGFFAPAAISFDINTQIIDNP